MCKGKYGGGFLVRFLGLGKKNKKGGGGGGSADTTTSKNKNNKGKKDGGKFDKIDFDFQDFDIPPTKGKNGTIIFVEIKRNRFILYPISNNTQWWGDERGLQFSL